MEEYLEILSGNPLFAGMDQGEIRALLKCIGRKVRGYEKNEYVMSAGDMDGKTGIVLAGSVNILKEDFWGNRMIIGKMEQGEMFGEAFALAGVTVLPVSVAAAEDTKVLFIDPEKLVNPCQPACKCHGVALGNMIRLLAGKNVMLTTKLGHVTRKTTREKLLSYLSEQAVREKKSQFTIPYNRQELADFLSVDRSAMSNELGKMSREGLIRFQRNQFQLLDAHFTEKKE